MTGGTDVGHEWINRIFFSETVILTVDLCTDHAEYRK